MIIDEQTLDQLIEKAESNLELDAVISTGALASRILDRKTVPSSRLPWGRAFGKFALRPGELTIWAGDNGSGKSLLVGQVVGWLLPQGQKALIASMEMRPEETVERIIRQCSGVDRPADGFVSDWCAWADERLYVYDVLDTVAAERVLRMIRAVATELGVQHVVLDSLVKCGVAQDGNGALTEQTQFVDKLQHLAKHLGIHIHLIAHTRKPERAGARVTKYDIRGASQITDLADNVCLLDRNRAKEEAKRVLPHERDDADLERLAEPDVRLTVAKQRHFSWEGTIALDYLSETGQFVSHGHAQAMPWPDDTVREPWRQL